MASRIKSNVNRKVNPKSLENLRKGGPGCKPKPPEIIEMFKGASTDAVQLLIDTMLNEDVKIDLRIDCANEILNRAFGKPSQSVDIGNKEGETFKTSSIDFSKFTLEQLRELIADEN